MRSPALQSTAAALSSVAFMRIKFKSAFASLSTRHGCLSSARMTHASAEYCELCIHLCRSASPRGNTCATLRDHTCLLSTPMCFSRSKTKILQRCGAVSTIIIVNGVRRRLTIWAPSHGHYRRAADSAHARGGRRRPSPDRALADGGPKARIAPQLGGVKAPATADDNFWVACEPPATTAALAPSRCVESAISSSAGVRRALPPTVPRVPHPISSYGSSKYGRCSAIQRHAANFFEARSIPAAGWCGRRRLKDAKSMCTLAIPGPGGRIRTTRAGRIRVGATRPRPAVGHPRANPRNRLRHSYLALKPGAAEAERTCVHEFGACSATTCRRPRRFRIRGLPMGRRIIAEVREHRRMPRGRRTFRVPSHRAPSGGPRGRQL